MAMVETCFCGWIGAIEDRTPVRALSGRWALLCPKCGHADELLWMPPEMRRGAIDEARHRRRGRGEVTEAVLVGSRQTAPRG